MTWRAPEGRERAARRRRARPGGCARVTVLLAVAMVLTLALGHTLLRHPHPPGDELVCAACATPVGQAAPMPAVARPLAGRVLAPALPPTVLPRPVQVLSLAPTRSPPASSGGTGMRPRRS